MGTLYRPQKVKSCPSDMTLDVTTRSLENINLTSCLCHGLDLTQQKEASRLKKRYSNNSENCKIYFKIFFSV